MMGPTDISGRLAVDVQGVERLRAQAAKDPDAALKSAAQQFEALFLNMLLKSMREAVPQNGLFDNEQTKLYTAMLDQQFAQSLSAKGIGLADIMVRQLGRAKPMEAGTQVVAAPQQKDAPSPMTAQPLEAPVSAPLPPPAAESQAPSSPTRDFVNRLWPHAVEASRATSIPPHFMLGQAALESGWGRREIRAADGSQSFNLFGIKAGRNWNGPVAEAVTTEYVNGVAQKTVEKFRAYSSYAEGFRDYANLLRSNPRYAAALGSGSDATGFARGLQQAGYATDPMYADKLIRILNGSVLRQSLIG